MLMSLFLLMMNMLILLFRNRVFCSLFSCIRTEDGEIWSIKSECGKIQTRKTPNADTFHAVHIPVLPTKVSHRFFIFPEIIG